ncbi:MAG: helix-turn-helix transcriptional regulator [bacterium]|nr:helix-turn-helix transcriptional regulator [bacterium]
MDQKLQAQYEARANIIKALAHPSRLFIVEELKDQERSVGELTAMIGSDASTVSKHLSILKNAGLVTDERQGTSIFYHLKCSCILDFISCIEEVLATNAQEKLDVLACCKTGKTR